MKKVVFLTVAVLFSCMFSLESCGPVVVTTKIAAPPPAWFYPNRAESVRYIYFPEHDIYYDFSIRSYLFLDNNIWITADLLPTKYRYLDLRRSRQIRVQDYFGDNINSYHNNKKYRSNSGRRTSDINRNPDNRRN